MGSTIMNELAPRAVESSIPWVCIYCGQEYPESEREEILKNHIRNDCEKHPWARARRRLREGLDIIEGADRRAEAVDGPVNHVRDEMTDDEWRKLYLAIKEAYEYE